VGFLCECTQKNPPGFFRVRNWVSEPWIVDAQNFNFAGEFHQNGGFCSPHFVFRKNIFGQGENFRTGKHCTGNDDKNQQEKPKKPGLIKIAIFLIKIKKIDFFDLNRIFFI